MVAKTFQSYEILGEPYETNKRLYVRVRNPKNGNERVVRWYSEAEYRKLYPKEETVVASATDYKKILGFEKGYITIFKGITDLNEEWFHRLPQARYHVAWGWYIISTEDVPVMLPDGVEAKELLWETIGNADNSLKNREEIRHAVENIIYDKDGSDFVGEIGERLDLTLTVQTAIPIETNFGRSVMYIFKDANNNELIWTTAAKVNLSCGSTYNMRGTIKDRRIYKGKRQSILNRCSIKED